MSIEPLRTSSRTILAGAVLLAALATPCAAQLLPLSASSSAPAVPGSFVWRTLVWQDRAPATLRESPLRALRPGRGVAVTSEWAPLYRGRDGTRIEQARQLARFTGGAGPLSLGAEVTREDGTFRGGESQWGVDATGEALRGGSVGVAWSRAIGGAALGASVSPAGRVGFAVEGEALVARGWRARLAASDAAQEGALDVRYQERAVAARGAWNERHAAVELAGAIGPGALTLAFESLDHVPYPSPDERDDLASRLAWRSERAAYTLEFRRLRVAAELDHGEGRQRIEVRRDRVAYAVAAGPLREDVVALRLGPPHARWSLRAWAGAAHASASGSLALWPFDGIAAAAGTRLAAKSALSLPHQGLSVDGAPAAPRGWDGGVALWALDPTGDYESWRGTLFGLGRDDDQRRALGVERTWLAGVRMARSQPVAGVTLRVEVVQWAPLTGQHHSSGQPSAAPAAPSPGSTPAAAGRTWGGTIVRIGI